jgi:hypothetical protein
MKAFTAMKLYSLFCAILLLLIFVSCNSRDKELKSGWWKYGDGFYLGDVLIFNDSNSRGDTIFIENKPIGTLVTVNSHMIEIISIASGERSSYFHK